MRTVSTSLERLSKMRILGGGASGAEVILIISGSLKKVSRVRIPIRKDRTVRTYLIGIIPKVMFLDDMS